MDYEKLVKKYKAEAADGPSSSGIEPGSAKPDNWVSQIQTGKNPEEIRQEAVRLNEMVTSWQANALEAHDIFSTLQEGGGKYFEMFNPVLMKGISRGKLIKLALILLRFARSAAVK